MRKASPRETRGLAHTKIRSEAAGRKGAGGNARRFCSRHWIFRVIIFSIKNDRLDGRLVFVSRSNALESYFR